MKTTLIIIIGFLIILYIGKPTINVSPFSIRFENPYIIFATIFLILSIICYSIHYEKIGYNRGINDSLKLIDKAIKESNKK